MTWLRLARSKIAVLLSARCLDDDFDEELASHLALAEDDGRRRGLTPDMARRAALMQLGGVTRARELPRVAVINETMARKYFPDGRALGRTMTMVRSRPIPELPIGIVGIVRDSRYNDVRGDILPLFYVPYQQEPGGVLGIELRTTEPIAGVTEAVRQAVVQVAPDMMIRSVRTLTEQVDRTIGPERLIANLCAAFGGLALLLAGIGLYGVMAYSVALRTGEIGIRMALGATRGGVVRLMLTESAPIVCGGVLLGLIGAWAASRLIGTFLFGLAPTDAATMIAATIVLAAVAALAVYVPARRAARVEPIVALRHD